MTDARTYAEKREDLAVITAKVKRIRATLPPDSPLVGIVWSMEALMGRLDAELHASQLREERGRA